MPTPSDLVVNLSANDAQLNESLRKIEENLKRLSVSMTGAGNPKAFTDAADGADKMAEKVHEARGAAALLGEETGVRLNRHLRSVLATSELLAPAMALAFYPAAIIGFIEVAGKIPEALKKGADALVGWNESVRKSYESAIAENKIYLATQEKAKLQAIEIANIGTTGQSKITGEQDKANVLLQQATAKREQLASEQLELQKILDSRKDIAGKMSSEVMPAEMGASPSVSPERVPLPFKPMYEDEQKTLERVRELKTQVAELRSKEDELGRKAGAGTDKELSVERASEARAEAMATADALKTRTEAHIAAERQSLADRLREGKINDQQEIAALKELVQKKLKVENDALSARIAQEQQHAKDNPGYQAGPEITRLQAQQDANRTVAGQALTHLDSEGQDRRKQRELQTIAEMTATYRQGSIERVQMADNLVRYMEAEYGKDNEHYRSALVSKAQADREYADETKRIALEVERVWLEASRRIGDADINRGLVAQLSRINLSELQARGMESLGMIGPERAARMLAGGHQAQLSAQLAAQDAKIKEQQALVDAAATPYRDATAGAESEKAMKEFIAANAELTNRIDERTKIEQSGAATALQDEYHLLQVREDGAAGAIRAMLKYQQSAHNTAAQVEQFFNGAFRGIEDSLAQMIVHGKANWSSFFDQIAMDLARMATKNMLGSIIGGGKSGSGGGGGGGILGGLLGGIFKSGGGGGGSWDSAFESSGNWGWDLEPHASGGDVIAGQGYLVGEQGPEPFFPNVSGTMLPNSAMSAKTSGSTYYIDARGADESAVETRVQRSLAAVHGSAVRGGAMTAREMALRRPRNAPR